MARRSWTGAPVVLFLALALLGLLGLVQSSGLGQLLDGPVVDASLEQAPYSYDPVGSSASAAGGWGAHAVVDAITVSTHGKSPTRQSPASDHQSVSAAKAADDWPVLSGIVRDAGKSKGNFGLGSGTASQAERAGQAWVGDGFRVASDGKTLVSSDGLRAFRPPSWKPNEGKYQANFEHWVDGQVSRSPMGNGHFDVTDLGL